jgi:hypothetical protein
MAAPATVASPAANSCKASANSAKLTTTMAYIVNEVTLADSTKPTAAPAPVTSLATDSCKAPTTALANSAKPTTTMANAESEVTPTDSAKPTTAPADVAGSNYGSRRGSRGIGRGDGGRRPFSADVPTLLGIRRG